MPTITGDRALETSTTTGNGAYTLNGAITGFRTFASVPNITTGQCDYFAEDVDTNGVPLGDWEVGTGIHGPGNTLARTVTASSNANALVNWGVGTRRIGISLTATRLQGLIDTANDSIIYAVLFGSD